MYRLLPALAIGVLAAAPPPEPLKDPRAISAHPFAGPRGAAFTAAVRGEGLSDATGVFLDNAPFQATIASVGVEPPGDASARAKRSFDLVQLRITVDPGAAPGSYPIRLITPRGVSNALPIFIAEGPVAAEPEGAHDTPAAAIPVAQLPAHITGRISTKGEADYYAIDAQAGQQISFETISGLPAPGAPGGNANGFDPSLSIFEPSGSWFDSGRLNRVAFIDEPLWVVGQRTDAHLVHRFARAGRYYLRVEAFSGQGGPDYSYLLKIAEGVQPQYTPPATGDWEERTYSRKLSPERLQQLAVRGGKAPGPLSLETYGPNSNVKLPAAIEGAIAAPGETHRARFTLDKPQDIAIEIETPDTAPPEFTPIVRLLDSRGEEAATNLFAGRGACTGALNKSTQSKVIVPLRDTGAYTLEIREATADLASPGFRYRVVVRPQVPHIGNVNVQEDRLNLAPGAAKTVRVSFDREEDFRGAVAVIAENLPPGVTALSAADYEPDKDPPMTAGKRERYVPRTERMVVAFTADPGAAPTPEPRFARLTVRPIVDGKPGAVIASKQIPIMVVTKP